MEHEVIKKDVLARKLQITFESFVSLLQKAKEADLEVTIDTFGGVVENIQRRTPKLVVKTRLGYIQ